MKKYCCKRFQKIEYWFNYSSDTRNKIRKAENNNIIVKLNILKINESFSSTLH